MKITNIICGLAVGLIIPLQAVNLSGYRQARELEKEKRYDEAIAIYEKMSDAFIDEKDDQRCMELAIAAARAKKDPAAMQRLAARIKSPIRRAYVLMGMMKPAEIIEKFKNTDLESWPEDIRKVALFRRGMAYRELKNYDKALTDLLAADHTPGGQQAQQIAIPAYIAAIYRTQLKNTAKAEEYYRKALAAGKADFAIRCGAVIEFSNMLIGQKRAAEAVELFAPVERLEKTSFHAFERMNRAYAAALIAAGKKVEAMKVLERLLNAAPEKQKAVYQKQIDQLTEELL